jgi:hypothetical protein
MKNKKENQINRRNFLKSAGIAGVSGALGAAGVHAQDANTPDNNIPHLPPEPIPVKIPRRKLGKTGVEVPILSLGFGRPGESVVLRQALDWGVNHWDTSFIAANGASEQSIGDFLAKNPGARKDVFIVTKESNSKSVEDIEKCLQTSLKRLNTDYIDLYFGVYMVKDMARFTDDVKKWVEDAKKRGAIKHFGFSTHENMAQCLSAAAKLGWIDAIQTKYDFRLMQDKQMQEAIDACYKAGIGLIAMKTQSMRPRGAAADPNEVEADRKMLAHFLEKGFTDGQAKIKAVMQDERISSVCSAMTSTAMLMTNIAAALDKAKLTAEDMAALRQYAQATCSGYCAGCSSICEQAAAGVPVSDIMRALMYHNSYGDKQLAKETFAQIPAETRGSLLSVDYSAAELRCPNKMPISRLISEAVSKFV